MGRWEQQQAAKKGFRIVAMAHSDCVRKAKAHLELKVERDVEDHKAIFCHWMGSKRISKENAGLLLNRTDWVTVHTGKNSSGSPSLQNLFSLSFHWDRPEVSTDELPPSWQRALEADSRCSLGLQQQRRAPGQVKHLLPWPGSPGPHQEYCSWFWACRQRTDVGKLEQLWWGACHRGGAFMILWSAHIKPWGVSCNLMADSGFSRGAGLETSWDPVQLELLCDDSVK